jgi:hypothetical protein
MDNENRLVIDLALEEAGKSETDKIHQQQAPDIFYRIKHQDEIECFPFALRRSSLVRTRTSASSIYLSEHNTSKRELSISFDTTSFQALRSPIIYK